MRRAKFGIGIALASLVGCATAQPKPIEPTWALPPHLPAATLPMLMQSLASAESGTRASAAWQLARLKEPQPEVVAALEAHRADADRSVRYAVAWALGRQRPTGGERSASDVSQQATARPKRITRPEYPDAAYATKLEGTVVLAILVGEEGEVAYAEILQSIPALDAAALACVREWQFEPMRVAGVPQATVAHAPIAFRVY